MCDTFNIKTIVDKQVSCLKKYVPHNILQRTHDCEQQQKVWLQWTTWYDHLRMVKEGRAERPSLLRYTYVSCAL
jgi:hypothetical protein